MSSWRIYSLRKLGGGSGGGGRRKEAENGGGGGDNDDGEDCMSVTIHVTGAFPTCDCKKHMDRQKKLLQELMKHTKNCVVVRERMCLLF